MKKVFVVFLALFGFAVIYALTFPSSGQAQWGPGEHISDDLVACWDMEEESGTRYDAVGDNNFTDNNTVSFTSDALWGNAAHIRNDNTEYLSITDNPEISGGQDFTKILFVKNADQDHGDYAYLLRKTDDYAIYYDTNTGDWEFYAGGWSSLSGYSAVEQWMFLAFWDDQDGDACMSIDNESPACASISSSDTDSEMRVGNSADGWGWSGYIDTVAMWNRILSADEITWVYNSGNGRSCSNLIDGPTPTPAPTMTPTPGPDLIELPDGQRLYMDQSISYGDVGVYVLLLSVLLFLMIYGLVWITRSGLGG